MSPVDGPRPKRPARATQPGEVHDDEPLAPARPSTQARTAAERTREAARRTLEKLGRKVSLAPAPEVAVADRAGKTAAVHAARAGARGVYAAIDLGSSSAKMLVQKRGADGRMRTVLDEKIGCALGRGVENGKPIPAENQQRALAALARFVDDAGKLGVKPGDIAMITTAVVRNSPNGAAFLDAVHAAGLVRARVLSGDDEAAMGFRGAIAMMDGAPGRYATLDLGGGSFQLAVGGERGFEQGGSTQVGSNLILDTMLKPAARPDGAGDPAVFTSVDAKLDEIAPPPLAADVLRGRTLVATGGVSKFLRAHFGKDVVTRGEIDSLRREVVALPYDARIPLVQRGKDADTQKALGIDTPAGALDYGKKLPASASLLLHILDGLGVDDVRVSSTDARHALIADLRG